MSDAPIISVPGLHPDARLLGWWPDAYANMFFVTPLADAPEPSALPIAWPIGAREARACLEHTERLTATMDAESLRVAASSARDSSSVLGAELDSARRQLGMEADDASARSLAVRAQAQEMLLLALAQEHQVAELCILAARYRDESQRLHEALREGQLEEQRMSGTQGTQGAVAFTLPGSELDLPLDEDRLAAFLPAWQIVLERLSVFLPETAVLCTADPRMLAALAEIEPPVVPTKVPQALVPLAERAGVRCVRWFLPLWRVCGLTSAEQAAAKPWLLRECELFGVSALDHD